MIYGGRGVESGIMERVYRALSDGLSLYKDLTSVPQFPFLSDSSKGYSCSVKRRRMTGLVNGIHVMDITKQRSFIRSG